MFHTAGEPPSRGSTILKNMGCTTNNNRAPRPRVTAYNASMKKPQ